MGKIGAYEPIDKYKNYTLPTAKPLRSHPIYQEKVWTLQERIYKKLKRVAEFLESLYPKLTDNLSNNIKLVVEKNVETLIKKLDLMQHDLEINPESFNTNNLQKNQHRITEMKNACNTLQTVRSYEYEFKNLGKIKHTLSELEHLIQPTSFEQGLEKARVKNKSNKLLGEAIKNMKEKSKLKSKNPRAISKKAKSATMLPKQSKIENKQPKKSEKKVIKPKSKLPGEKILKAQSKSKIKSSAERKKK